MPEALDPSASLGQALKACCAALYESPAARWLLGESFHPGGEALTLCLGRALGLAPGSLVLDLACGTGASASLLRRSFGWRLVGADLSQSNLRRLATNASPGLGPLRADGERLPLASGCLDGITIECAFCTFPDQAAAAAEMARVLRPGGRLGIADVTLEGPLPAELAAAAARAACLGSARPLSGYVETLQRAGLADCQVEEHPEALAELVRGIATRLDGLEGSGLLPPGLLEPARAMVETAGRLVESGQAGYALMTATRV